MALQSDLTQSDSYNPEFCGWELSQPQSALWSVEPPSNFTGLYLVVMDDTVRVTERDLTYRRGVRTIAPELHEMLLDESLQEYGDIWRNLAER